MTFIYRAALLAIVSLTFAVRAAAGEVPTGQVQDGTVRPHVPRLERLPVMLPAPTRTVGLSVPNIIIRPSCNFDRNDISNRLPRIWLPSSPAPATRITTPTAQPASSQDHP